MKEDSETVIVGACRTPIGAFGRRFERPVRCRTGNFQAVALVTSA